MEQAATQAGIVFTDAAARKVLELILEELSVLCELEVPGDELSRMKENLKGNVVLGLESTAGRMSSLAQQEIYFGRTFEIAARFIEPNVTLILKEAASEARTGT